MPIFQNIPNHIVKSESGKAHWVSRSAAAVVTIILNNSKVLILKRGKNISASGKWCTPCGYFDWNENGTDCSIREVWEETGLDLSDTQSPFKVVKSYMNYPWDIVTDPTLNYNQDIALYYGISIQSEIEPILTTANCEEGEVDDVKWVNISDLNQYNFAFNHDKRIAKFLEHIK